MRDWATVGLSNRYAAAGLDLDLEAALGTVQAEVRSVLLRNDPLVPQRSLQALLHKMPRAPSTVILLDSAALGVRADHFAWMKQPQGIVRALLARDTLESAGQMAQGGTGAASAERNRSG